MEEGGTGEASDIDDLRPVTSGNLFFNFPHPRVNKTDQRVGL